MSCFQTIANGQRVAAVRARKREKSLSKYEEPIQMGKQHNARIRQRKRVPVDCGNIVADQEPTSQQCSEWTRVFCEQELNKQRISLERHDARKCIRPDAFQAVSCQMSERREPFIGSPYTSTKQRTRKWGATVHRTRRRRLQWFDFQKDRYLKHVNKLNRVSMICRSNIYSRSDNGLSTPEATYARLMLLAYLKARVIGYIFHILCLWTLTLLLMLSIGKSSQVRAPRLHWNRCPCINIGVSSRITAPSRLFSNNWSKRRCAPIITAG